MGDNFDARQLVSDNDKENVVIRVKAPTRITFFPNSVFSVVREFQPGSYTVSRVNALQMLPDQHVVLVSGDLAENDIRRRHLERLFAE